MDDSRRVRSEEWVGPEGTPCSRQASEQMTTFDNAGSTLLRDTA